MQKQIVKDPNPILHTHAIEVPIVTITSKKIQRVIQEMKNALRTTKDGIGIAAPQVGHALRMFLASEEALQWKKTKNHKSIPDNRNESNQGAEKKKPEWNYYVFINPCITKTSQKKVLEVEGCLSVPGIYGAVERAEKVTVQAYDEYGNKFTRGAAGLYAKVMQHEVDHLNGILFISKAHDIKRLPHKQTEL